HIEAFANALGADEVSYETQDVLSPTVPGTPLSPVAGTPMRIHKVSAMSDFAPVNMKVKKARNEGRIAKEHEGRSKLPGRSIYYRFLDDAFTWGFQEWKEAAVILDEYLHFQGWKNLDEDNFYDWKLVRKVSRLAQ
ncbi:hypothetical protein C0992_002180, partial [Termitomyces sp. T32_za158]